MQRGKIIGAVVLVLAIGLIVVQQMGGFGGGAPESPETAAAGVRPVAATGPGGASLAGLPAVGEQRAYAVDPEQSEIFWRIYRSGALARLGHNHVISMTGYEGIATLGNDLAQASWRLSFPVAGLVIDDPGLRSRFGEDFESVPSEDDKAGTRTNMLSESLLNGAAFPDIVLEGTGMLGTPDAAQLPVTIRILGRTVDATFPATISISEDAITVTGEYRLTHQDLGLTPFTALGGAMAVGDEIDFTYRIHAVAGSQ